MLTWDDTAGKWVNGALADVATTGDYGDLLNTPTLGTAAEADSTDTVTEDSNDLLTSGGAYTALGEKVDKETGKGLSTNDFTDAYKEKLDGAVDSISVNGVAQTITSGAVDLDVASNLITETQWTQIGTILS